MSEIDLVSRRCPDSRLQRTIAARPRPMWPRGGGDSNGRSLVTPVLPLLMLIQFLGGCSVAKVVSQPGPADLKGIGIGTSRIDMISRLGPPRAIDTDKNGNKMDMFEFQSGAHQASKARAIPYLAADVFTLGLAELILWPIEMTAFEAATCHGMATYNAQQKVIAWEAKPKAGQSSVQDC